MSDAPSAILCPGCGAPVPPALLNCPSCNRLLHADRLKEIAALANDHMSAGRRSDALELWREALELLPPESVQYQKVRAIILDLTGEAPAHSSLVTSKPAPPAPAASSAPPRPDTTGFQQRKRKGGLAAAAGAVGLLLVKFKAVLLFALTKAKLLLLGLKSGTTLLTMFLSMGLYWQLWGWQFAVGLILSIYVHEMGHVARLRKYGIKATAPMFIPGLGAMIRVKQRLASDGEDARVGLAGPIWGLGAAVVAAALYFGTNIPVFGGIAQFGAYINLFNLIAIPPLDGGRGFRALVRWQRLFVAIAFGGAFFLVHDGLLMILALVAGARTFTGQVAEKADNTILLQFLVLIAALSAIMLIRPVPA